MRSDLGMAAAVVLAVTFAWAGAAKLGHPAGTAGGFADLGLPRPQALARVIPGVELVLAVALLAAPGAGAAAALVLLAVFSAVLTRALRRGVAVRCACFGRAGGAPLSSADLVRNGLLGLLAAMGVASGVEPHRPGAVAVALMAAAVTGGAVLLATLRRRR